MDRRQFIQQFAAGAVLSLIGAPPVLAADTDAAFKAAMARLESRHGGRLGVAVVDTGGGRRITHRGNERFLLCSTVKFPTAALILSHVDAGAESLARHIDYSEDDVVTYSPETKQHVATGMTLGAICRAGLTQSDNTAANLMLHSVGGPAAVTRFVRSLGDDVTRSDRYETALNDYTPGNPHDTTTPSAMLGLMQRILLGHALSAASTQQLMAWMRACQTGDHRLRAGLPAAWRVGDKTGSGGDNSANDIAIIQPPHRQPILVAAYYTGSTATHAQRDRVLADVGRAVAGVATGPG
ncbi:class A beta-lactamase [Salinisphaera sp. RV14]|uniref:class A beta-lactamase n=1 Tax=Salinisphaera sp. RV14 TaxID=3454140 RepID=UPI003F84D2F9